MHAWGSRVRGTRGGVLDSRKFTPKAAQLKLLSAVLIPSGSMVQWKAQDSGTNHSGKLLRSLMTRFSKMWKSTSVAFAQQCRAVHMLWCSPSRNFIQGSAGESIDWLPYLSSLSKCPEKLVLACSDLKFSLNVCFNGVLYLVRFQGAALFLQKIRSTNLLGSMVDVDADNRVSCYPHKAFFGHNNVTNASAYADAFAWGDGWSPLSLRSQYC